jgi:HK97 family phage prohead protease
MSVQVKRFYPMTIRSQEGAKGNIHGVPIVLEVPTDIGGKFKEIIRVNAISDELLKREIKLLSNHNFNGLSMASTLIPIDKLGGMEIYKKDKQIEFDANLNLQRNDSHDFYLAVQDGNIRGMSFAFTIEEDEWTDLDTDYPTRYINKIGDIVEISGVNFPAYPTTSIGLRSVESTESDSSVLEKARTDYLHKRNAENNATSELELEKLKAKYLYQVK